MMVKFLFPCDYMQNVTLRCFCFFGFWAAAEHSHNANNRVKRENLKQCPEMQACDSAWWNKGHLYFFYF